jgi:hypothetical protein
MPENSIRFGEHGARVMIEDEEIEHYAIDLNPAKKEVICWIASEEGKVRNSKYILIIFDILFIPTNLGVFS